MPVISSNGEIKKEMIKLGTVKKSLLDFDMKRKDENKFISRNFKNMPTAFYSTSNFRGSKESKQRTPVPKRIR